MKNTEQEEAKTKKQSDALHLLITALTKCRHAGVGTYRDGDMLADAMGKLEELGFSCVMVPADFKAKEVLL